MANAQASVHLKAQAGDRRHELPQELDPYLNNNFTSTPDGERAPVVTFNYLFQNC